MVRLTLGSRLGIEFTPQLVKPHIGFGHSIAITLQVKHVQLQTRRNDAQRIIQTHARPSKNSDLYYRGPDLKRVTLKLCIVVWDLLGIPRCDRGTPWCSHIGNSHVHEVYKTFRGAVV